MGRNHGIRMMPLGNASSSGLRDSYPSCVTGCIAYILNEVTSAAAPSVQTPKYRGVLFLDLLAVVSLRVPYIFSRVSRRQTAAITKVLSLSALASCYSPSGSCIISSPAANRRATPCHGNPSGNPQQQLLARVQSLQRRRRSGSKGY